MTELKIKLRVLAASFGLDYLEDADVVTDKDTGEPVLLLRGEKK